MLHIVLAEQVFAIKAEVVFGYQDMVKVDILVASSNLRLYS